MNFNIDTELMITITAGILLAFLIRHIVSVGIGQLFGNSFTPANHSGSSSGSGQVSNKSVKSSS